MSLPPPLLVVAGATATGKTGLAVRVALALRSEGVLAEVISADSRQVFLGLDIGTMKATVAERQGVPHHGIDLVEPDVPFSVADFVDHVATVLPAIADAGGLAILAGGTGLYLRAIARGLNTAALPSDPTIRSRLEAEFLADGLDPLVDRLRTDAPERAAHVDLKNPRRVVRALEIAQIDGGRGRLPPPRGYGGPVSWVGLQLEASAHSARIAERARAQFDAGLVAEARGLQERFGRTGPAFSAIGYREAWAVVDGVLTVEQAMTEVARRTVSFAKRQRTWFRRESDIEWFDASTVSADRAADMARRLMDRA